jgi:hypothetical protein
MRRRLRMWKARLGGRNDGYEDEGDLGVRDM